MSKVNVGLLTLKLDWKLISLISDVNRFDAEWESIERREGQSLKELKSIATVRSVGASTRIEGSTLTDEEVDTLLKNIDISKLQKRDQQEVVGYFEVLDIISESNSDILITENALKNLHNILMRYSEKDQWHKGDYKQHTNSVQAQMPDGSFQVIFRTAEPGFATVDSMRRLLEWYHEDIAVDALVKCAVFCYEFVTIHPFQDGNGRMSRLLAVLLLRKAGYRWIQYVSLEHEIEHQKTDYYKVLRSCQVQRPSEDITEWVLFFLNCLKNIQNALMQKLKIKGVEQHLTRREKMILTIIGANPGIKSGEIAKKLDLSIATVKRALTKLLAEKFIEAEGNGAGTNYHLI